MLEQVSCGNRCCLEFQCARLHSNEVAYRISFRRCNVEFKRRLKMASFDLSLPIVLKFEGCYVDEPTHPGGEPNKGVTMATFRSCSHDLLGIDPTSQNLKALTDAQAGII